MESWRIREIKELLGGLSANGGLWLDVGEVVGVDGEVCEVEIGRLRIGGVWLCGVNDERDGSLVVRPKIGSKVLVGDLSGGDKRQLVVLKYTEVESIVVNGGENGGLVNIGALKEWMGNVERDLRSLSEKLATTVVAGNGAPLGLVFSPSTVSVEGEIEDEKIKH